MPNPENPREPLVEIVKETDNYIIRKIIDFLGTVIFEKCEFCSEPLDNDPAHPYLIQWKKWFVGDRFTLANTHLTCTERFCEEILSFGKNIGKEPKTKEETNN